MESPSGMIFTPESRWNQTLAPASALPESIGGTPESGPNDEDPVPPHPATTTQTRHTPTPPTPTPRTMDTVRQGADPPARTQARLVARHAPTVRWPMLPGEV